MSDDLISRSALLEELERKGYPATREEVDIMDTIDNQPTAYDVEKAVEKIRKNTKERCACELKCEDCIINNNCGILEAIEIVKGGGQGE